MIDFTIEDLVTVNISSDDKGQALYIVNDTAMPREDFSAVMLAVIVMLLAQATPDSED